MAFGLEYNTKRQRQTSEHTPRSHRVPGKCSHINPQFQSVITVACAGGDVIELDPGVHPVSHKTCSVYMTRRQIASHHSESFLS